MTTRIFLVRHGSTILSAEDRFAGSTDVPLSDEGREQARRLAHRLSKETIDAIYASPLKRTMETAEIVAAPHDKKVIQQDAFREISHGRWEERTRAEVETLFPDEYSKWEEDPFTFAPEGGESGLQVTARALPLLLQIVRSHQGKKALIVSHKATIRLILSLLLGFDPRAYRDRLDQSPTSLNILDFKDQAHARLILFNDVSHCSYSSSETPNESHRRLSKWW
jgi:broad specificity phosphatase PhoE